jgi:hypothetical protein
MEMCDQRHATDVLSPGKDAGTHCIRRLDGPRNRRGRFGEEKRRLRAPGIKVRIVKPIA